MTQQRRFEPWVHTSDLGVLVVPVSVLKQRKPSIGDVIKLASFQWDELKKTGQYQRVQLHPDGRDQWGYPAPLASVAPNPDVVDIQL